MSTDSSVQRPAIRRVVTGHTPEGKAVVADDVEELTFLCDFNLNTMAITVDRPLVIHLSRLRVRGNCYIEA